MAKKKWKFAWWCPARAGSDEQANIRRHRAKTDRDKRLNHSKDYYELLGYSCYITSVDQEIFSAAEVQKVYGLRWRIENPARAGLEKSVSFTKANSPRMFLDEGKSRGNYLYDVNLYSSPSGYCLQLHDGAK